MVGTRGDGGKGQVKRHGGVAAATKRARAVGRSSIASIRIRQAPFCVECNGLLQVKVFTYESDFGQATPVKLIPKSSSLVVDNAYEKLDPNFWASRPRQIDPQMFISCG